MKATKVTSLPNQMYLLFREKRIDLEQNNTFWPLAKWFCIVFELIKIKENISVLFTGNCIHCVRRMQGRKEREYRNKRKGSDFPEGM